MKTWLKTNIVSKTWSKRMFKKMILEKQTNTTSLCIISLPYQYITTNAYGFWIAIFVITTVLGILIWLGHFVCSLSSLHIVKYLLSYFQRGHGSRASDYVSNLIRSLSCFLSFTYSLSFILPFGFFFILFWLKID